LTVNGSFECEEAVTTTSFRFIFTSKRLAGPWKNVRLV
jgi:hypothetical protein